MALLKRAVYRAKLQAIKTTLDRAPASEKRNNIATALAKDFNGTLDVLRSEFPEIADALPAPIHSSTSLRHQQRADANYLDLEVFCEQVLNLLALVEE